MDHATLATQYADRSQELVNERAEAVGAAQRTLDAATRTARETRSNARHEADLAYNKVEAELQATYEGVRNAADKKYEAARTELLEELVGKDDPDGTGKLVAWMIQDGCWDRFPDHCKTVLEALPKSLPDLVAYAREQQGWCSDFNDLLFKAIKADAVPGVTALEGAQFAVQYAADNYDGYSTAKRRLQAAIDSLLELTTQSADARAEKSDKPEA